MRLHFRAEGTEHSSGSVAAEPLTGRHAFARSFVMSMAMTLPVVVVRPHHGRFIAAHAVRGANGRRGSVSKATKVDYPHCTFLSSLHRNPAAFRT